jgi:hypothetical protein
MVGLHFERIRLEKAEQVSLSFQLNSCLKSAHDCPTEFPIPTFARSISNTICFYLSFSVNFLVSPFSGTIRTVSRPEHVRSLAVDEHLTSFGSGIVELLNERNKAHRSAMQMHR